MKESLFYLFSKMSKMLLIYNHNVSQNESLIKHTI